VRGGGHSRHSLGAAPAAAAAHSLAGPQQPTQHGWCPAPACDTVDKHTEPLQGEEESNSPQRGALITTSAATQPAGDVVSVQAGFNHDYGCVYKDVPEYEHLIRVLPRCFTEVMLRVANPLRPIFPTWFKGGDKVSANTLAHGFTLATCLQSFPASAGPALVTHC
jgi:hypothetical protein